MILFSLVSTAKTGSTSSTRTIGEILDEQVIGTTNNSADFPSVIRKENIMGIQCHPERSHRSGLRLLRNFMELI